MRLDIIGDVHGDRTALERLLSLLGYSPRSGAWRHPDRKALFIGDLIDRGDDVPGVLALVKAMVDAGEARIVLGNHEFNLLCWYTPDGKGGYLWGRGDIGKERQISRSRPYFDSHPADREMYLEWFRSLPLTLELDGARFVHAYWGAREIALLGGRNTLDSCDWGDTEWRRKPLGIAVERLLKGPEFKLPDGYFTNDRQGGKRRMVRVCWWKDGRGRSVREMVLPFTPNLPEDPLSDEGLSSYEAYGPEKPLVFFGHYGFRAFPGILAPNACCVDYTEPGPRTIGAYRWDGERQLSGEKFVRGGSGK